MSTDKKLPPLPPLPPLPADNCSTDSMDDYLTPQMKTGIMNGAYMSNDLEKKKDIYENLEANSNENIYNTIN